MTKDRFVYLRRASIGMIELKQPITREEYNEGYHFCYDWDGLFIGPEGFEWSCCQCHPLKKQINKVRGVIQKAYFKQKEIYNAYCSFDKNIDQFILSSAKYNNSHVKIENHEYKTFKNGWKAATDYFNSILSLPMYVECEKCNGSGVIHYNRKRHTCNHCVNKGPDLGKIWKYYTPNEWEETTQQKLHEDTPVWDLMIDQYNDYYWECRTLKNKPFRRRNSELSQNNKIIYFDTGRVLAIIGQVRPTPNFRINTEK